ncbi:peptide ABC transporter permease [Saccharospirillum sp. MSK14-1]|uniref:ABC transporter permease n=1 Tax=Saccharospirillum sp. MSK14-1 TaxID=1897632 RepID=UPI000D3765C5|nr:FtsX-like permease family protein [Saccharospirillum sp. MSK14-1]PTY37499.1 peptide ABC transporter permease [Saccharospirillum sp. MSK14-1]
MNWINLALRSLWNRRSTAVLTLLMVALSLALLLTVDRVRQDTRASFSNTLSGTDLIVGGRTGGLNLLLYSVFRIGNATNNISWQTYDDIRNNDAVAWTIPFSLGDSHHGYRVLGTNNDYFEHYQYGRRQNVSINEGRRLEGVYDVVLGSAVAKALDYQLGDEVVIAHGLGSTSFEMHDDKPFTVVGILAPTGTPVDRTLHIPLEGMTAIHVDWTAGVRLPGFDVSAEEALDMDLTPDTVTAVLVGMESRIQALGFQRRINQYRAEPLTAIIPGATLAELWQMIGIAENALIAISGLVVVTGLLGMVTVILAGLNERRREMAILRALGARPSHILGLLMIESGFYGIAGLVLGLLLHWALIAIAALWVQPAYGIQLTLSLPVWPMSGVLLAVVALSILIGLAPGWKAYRRSLSDGLTVTT